MGVWEYPFIHIYVCARDKIMDCCFIHSILQIWALFVSTLKKVTKGHKLKLNEEAIATTERYFQTSKIRYFSDGIKIGASQDQVYQDKRRLC